jgi:CheY-like chemotaxis protein
VADTSVILIIEDRADDVLLIQRAFKKAGIPNPVHAVCTGEDAIAYLIGEGRYANRAEYPLPALILLDLKMPGIDGFDFLAWIRQHEGIRTIPVAVLTSSSDRSDVNRAYRLGANTFFVKEFDFQDTVELAKLIHKWLQKARFPDSSRKDRKPDGHTSGH